MRRRRRAWIDVLVSEGVTTTLSGIKTHRRRSIAAEPGRMVNRIPVTDPVATLVDLATCIESDELEEAVNEADRLDLLNPEELRSAIQLIRKRPGVGRLRKLLDRQTYRVTHSVLEREFLRLVRATELPLPQTQVYLHGYRVDFYWPELGLVVETDGLRHHHTASQQATDRRRDQVHTEAGLTTLRFTTAQVRFEPEHVQAILTSVKRRLAAEGGQ
jgi:very-short-patch-repair endonuclease